MAKIKRTRIAPIPDDDTHEIYGRGGLGADSDADAESVYVVADRIDFGAALISDGGSGELRTAWTSCQDCSILRVATLYRANTGDREVLVAFRDINNVPCPGSGLFTPVNSGVETAGSSGIYYGGHYFVFDCRGMKDFMVIVKPGTPNMDVYGAAS